MAAKLLSRERKTAWLGLLAGAAVVVLVGQLLLLKFGSGVARWSYDLPYTWKQQNVPEELVMVYLDSKIKSQLGQSTDQPLDRRFYTRLLERLTREGARLVLFDILFDSPQADSNADAGFAEAIRKHGKVVLVGDYVRQWQGDYITSSPLPPIAILTDAAAGWGLANVPIDSDYEVRRLGTGTEDLPSAGWVAAALLGAETTRLPESRSIERWLNYYCEPTALRAVNLDHALEPDGLPSGYFHDKIVVVGSRGEGGIAGAGRDEFRTPYSNFIRKLSRHEEPMAPGAAIHAFTLLNLVRGDWLTRRFAPEAALVFIWGILISVVLLNLRPWLAALVALAASGAFTYAAIWIQARHQLWFSWLTPAAVQTSVALVWSVGFQYGVEFRRRRRLRRAFAVYLSPHMADRIANSDFDLSLGGKEVEATVMFTDLEGFALMAETMPPAEVSRILTSYFTEATREILEQDGTIIKYVGDAVMAVWGAPLADPRPAQRAVVAALGIRAAGRKDIAGRRLRTRIGINSGTVLAGNLGSEFRFDYTLIGEATNTASRLEGMNKHLGTDILISDATRRELDDQIIVRSLGRFILAGTTRPTAVFEVLGTAAEFQPPPPWLDEFAQALAHFAKREFDQAEGLLRKILAQRNGQDAPADFYLKEIEHARATQDSGAAWDGSIYLETK